VRYPLTAAALTLALAACSPQPFDATSAWQPISDSGEGRAYRGGLMSSAPSSVFDEFEPDAGTDAPVGPQSRVPDPESGENPWATIPENPVVTVCYGSAFNDREQVRAAAQQLCPEGARLERLQTTTLQSDCPLLQPTRAAFRCWTDAAAGPNGDAGDAGDAAAAQ
jgi:hypothetical protein